MNKAKLEILSQKLEQLKSVKYECPGPSREVTEEVKNSLEAALNETPMMDVVRCIELNCMACEIYDEHAERADEVEEQLDAVYEEDEGEETAGRPA